MSQKPSNEFDEEVRAWVASTYGSGAWDRVVESPQMATLLRSTKSDATEEEKALASSFMSEHGRKFARSVKAKGIPAQGLAIFENYMAELGIQDPGSSTEGESAASAADNEANSDAFGGLWVYE